MMKRTLRMLLDYAEQQVDNVANVEDIIVCFAPSEDIECLVLVDGIHSIPSKEIWKCLQDCEKVEQANRIAQAVFQNDDTEGSLSNERNLPDKIAADVAQRSSEMVVEEVHEKMSQKCGREQLQINDSFRNESVVSATIMCRDNGQHDKNLFKYQSAIITRSTVTTGRSGIDVSEDEICFAETANGDNSTVDMISKIEQGRNEDEVALDLSYKVEPGHSINFPAYICPPQELIDASQPGYRPLQNLAPFITSASTPSFYLAAVIPNQNEAKSGGEIDHCQPLHQREHQHQQRYEDEEWQQRQVHDQLQQELKQQVSVVRQSPEETHHLRSPQNSSLISNNLSELVSSGEDCNGHNALNSSFSGDAALTKYTSYLQEDRKPTISSLCGTPRQISQHKCISNIDENDPLCFSQWPSWVWSRVFCHPLPLTNVIAAVGRSGGHIVYWMQQTIRVDDNLALEAALWLATRVGLELVVVAVVDAESYSDLLRFDDRSGNSEITDITSNRGIDSLSLAQRSFLRKSLTKFSAMESMDRSLRDLNVPFICLLEEPTSTPCNSSSNCTYGHVDSNNSSGAGVRFATGESDFHPTVAALLKFLTSLPATTNPDTNLSTSGAKSAGIFSLFTDDTYHPLSLFLRTSLVAQLPQMPIFCFDSESIVPPTAQHLKPIKTVNPTTSSRELFREDEREEFERLFNLWSEKAKVEDWRFGSRFLKAVPTGSTESRYGKHLCESRSNLESHLCSLSSCSDSSLKNTRTIKCVDLAVVRYIISLESVKKILSFPPEQSNTAEETMDTRVIIAGFLTGTVSPRRALLENDHGIKNAERVAMLNTKINSEISPGDLVGGEQKAENSAGLTAAVRSYLIEADQSRYSCFKEMKRGTLSVTRLVVFNNDAIASTSSSRLGASKGAWSSESTSVSLKPSSSVKWVIPWLQLLSPEASAILQRPNNFKSPPNLVYPIDVRSANTDDAHFNSIQSSLMLGGCEPRGPQAQYWLRFFLSRMGSRDLGLQVAINELSTHSRCR